MHAQTNLLNNQHITLPLAVKQEMSYSERESESLLLYSGKYEN